MYAEKPIIGLAGGIGAGKTFVARLFGEAGCQVISSDELVKIAYTHPEVKRQVQAMFGDEVFNPVGDIDRQQVARRVFQNVADREKLEKLLHPRVNEARVALMQQGAADPAVKAFVWDSPLLFETQLNQLCDGVVFVEAPLQERLDRVSKSRGWNEAELQRRENLQMPLDKKRQLADYHVSNTADVESVRGQVREVLSRIFARTSSSTHRE